MELELVLVERAAELGFYREAAPRLRRLLGLINLRPSSDLGLLDRELRIAEQLFRVVAGVHQRDADRAFDANLQLGKLEWRRHHALDPLRGLERVLHSAAKRHKHTELVAARPSEHVAGTKSEDEPPSKSDQKLVAREAAHRLVDAAE